MTQVLRIISLICLALAMINVPAIPANLVAAGLFFWFLGDMVRFERRP